MTRSAGRRKSRPEGVPLAQLTGSAREAALERLREWTVQDDWYTFTIDNWIEEMESKYGYTIDSTPRRGARGGSGGSEPAVYFSGFYVQGSGASFSGHATIEEWAKVNQEKQPDLYNFISAAQVTAELLGQPAPEFGTVWINSSDRGHCLTSDITIGASSDYWTPSEIEELILADAREHADRLFKLLESEYEYLTSDEQLLEMAEANEYLFDEETGELA